ncbi:MAG: GMC family oxidoreductase [Acidobacteriota bacterium]|nr:GMC family oxidoreductase [Acidobacteriota bacterium]
MIGHDCASALSKTKWIQFVVAIYAETVNGIVGVPKLYPLVIPKNYLDDASVFPQIPGFFIVSAVYMIAEKAAASIVQGA